MSSAVRHTFHTASDPAGLASNTPGGRAVAPPPEHAETVRPAPILIPSADIGAFDLFQPEPASLPGTYSEPAPPPSTAPFLDGQFSRQVARALDPPALVPAPPAPALNLPLGGLAPTAREIDSARALMLGWFAALGIAAFAFLSQGPTVTTRPNEEPEPTVVEPAAAPAALPGDIHLEAPPAKQPPARGRKVVRDPAPVPAAPSAQPKQ